jgi:hypothetical protein
MRKEGSESQKPLDKTAQVEMCLDEAVQREVIMMVAGPAEIAQKENLLLQ